MKTLTDKIAKANHESVQQLIDTGQISLNNCPKCLKNYIATALHNSCPNCGKKKAVVRQVCYHPLCKEDVVEPRTKFCSTKCSKSYHNANRHGDGNNPKAYTEQATPKPQPKTKKKTKGKKRICANTECGRKFFPHRGKKYCTPVCGYTYRNKLAAKKKAATEEAAKTTRQDPVPLEDFQRVISSMSKAISERLDALEGGIIDGISSNTPEQKASAALEQILNIVKANTIAFQDFRKTLSSAVDVIEELARDVAALKKAWEA